MPRSVTQKNPAKQGRKQARQRQAPLGPGALLTLPESAENERRAVIVRALRRGEDEALFAAVLGTTENVTKETLLASERLIREIEQAAQST